MPDQPFFSWPRPFVKDAMKNRRNVLFIPFAAVTFSFDDYETIVQRAFNEMDLKLKSIHREKDPLEAIDWADAIAIGGGNTFALLSRLYDSGLLDPIRNKIKTESIFIGWSAGSNVACPTLMTTNDMPIAQPRSFESLGLVPFQLNPHYTEFKQPGHGGESRMQRIEEFLMLHPHRKVIGLPEGTLLHISDEQMLLKGNGEAKLFEAGKSPVSLLPGKDLGFLL